MEAALRLNEIVPLTYANGPGARACIWVQGCSLACPGCFNPQTHDFSLGSIRSVQSIVDELTAISEIEGVTISGGEPFQQAESLLALLKLLRLESELSTIIFSGFEKGELERMAGFDEIKEHVDAIIAGRYLQQKRLASGLLGSTNQEILLYSDRYSLDDFRNIPASEVIINADGSITVSGVDPVRL